MKNLKLILPIFIALLLTNSTFTQSRFYGKVSEVIDGRTIVVEPQPAVKIKIQLQYIEVPEEEQKLHGVVKKHLTNLVLNKNVEFRPKNINETANPIGQILLGGVDISQQMLRDGAAWYSVSDKDIQSSFESKLYQENEALAKAEKRGVWSIPDLKPAWEFRAEKEEKRKQEELRKKEEEKARLAKIREAEKERLRKRAEERRIARAKANSFSVGNTGSGLGIEVWQENAAAGLPKKTGYENLYFKSIPQYGIEYTLTGGNFAEFNFDKNKIKIESRSLHIKRDNSSLNLKNVFGIGFLAKSEKGKFAESNDLTIHADAKVFKLGRAYRLLSSDGETMTELLLYEVKEEQLAEISKAKEVKVQIGDYKGSIDKKYQSMVKDLVESSK